MAFQKAPLDERLAAVRAEVEAFIDMRVAAEAKLTPGVPSVVIRRLIENRSGDCLCRQYLDLKKQSDEAATRENAA